MQDKKKRLKVIAEIIRNQNVYNQEMLLHLLEKEGFMVTQATLSRDIKVLKIVKSPDAHGNYKYILPQENKYTNSFLHVPASDILSSGFRKIEFSGNLGVVKTLPGHASAIALTLDNQAEKEILGTIAGDDTILVIPREGVSKEDILELISRLFPERI